MSDAPQRLDLAALPASWPLFDTAASRAVEAHAASGLPAHTLMQRAGLAAARLALALTPHSRRVWIAAGPGNNGGDGLEAGMHLARAGREVAVTLLGDAARRPADAAASLARAQAAGCRFVEAPPEDVDLVIDALLGLGVTRAPEGALAAQIAAINRCTAVPRLALDLPSGLVSDTGALVGAEAVRATDTLALLTLKPGLATAQGRDHAGRLWFDDLGTRASWGAATPRAWLVGAARVAATRAPREHASHKGRFGDAIVVGGAPGMAGAALLAARAALAAGAGRVFASLLDAGAATVDARHPELMLRPALAHDAVALANATVVAGCGGGDAVRGLLPLVLSRSARLVLDADALNALAADAALQSQLAARASRGLPTVLTPHPLEAARLLGQDSAAQVQADRLAAAEALSRLLDCAVVLKGSGSVIAAPGVATAINPTGNGRLASAGTGDVLAGWIGGRWSAAAATDAAAIAQAAVWEHGAAAGADAIGGPLLASGLIERLVALRY